MRTRKALIATLPKSGTWYCHTFFWYYDQLVGRAWDYLEGRFKPNLAQALTQKKIINRSSHSNTLGIDELFICHTVCPGFENSGDAATDIWKALHFPLPCNWGENWLRKHDNWTGFDPSLNPDARIVYIFRNPLDHFVSFWRHAQTHVDDAHRMRTGPYGRHPIKNLHEFVFDFGILGAFIKHYYSFRQMARRFPGQILMMPYERLTQQPKEAFGETLAFIGTPATGVLRERLFADALAICSRDSLAAIEAKIGRSLADDQLKGGRHIRDGSIGKWQQHFSRDEIEAIESVFSIFDMTLSEFTLAGAEEDPLPWLNTIAPTRKHQHKEAFFRQQLSQITGDVSEYRGHSAYPEAVLRVGHHLRKGMQILLRAHS